MYDDDKVKSLHIMFPKATAHVKSYGGQAKWMYFLIKGNEFLEKHNTIWDNVSADIKKWFHGQPFYNKIFLKIKIKPHGVEVTECYNKEIPSLGSNQNCLAVISLDSALKTDENYYPQVFLKECKYIKKVIRHINGNFSHFFLLMSLMENKLE